MRIYRLDYQDAAMGNCQSWHGSKRDAKREARKIWEENYSDEERRHSFSQPSVVPVDFPTTKTALLNWLNVHFGTDNG